MASIANNLVFDQDMDQEVKIRQIHGSLFEGDNKGLRLKVNCFRNGSAANLSGSITCYVMKQDGTLTTISGSASGNTATVQIPSSALMPGPIKIIVRNVDGSTKTTLLAITGTVSIVNGTAFIDPGSVIPSLSAYEDLVDRAEAAATTIGHLTTSVSLHESDDRFKCSVSLS